MLGLTSLFWEARFFKECNRLMPSRGSHPGRAWQASEPLLLPMGPGLSVRHGTALAITSDQLFALPYSGGSLDDLRRKVWEKNLQGLKSWAWLPKSCRTFGVLQNLSSTSVLLREMFCRTFLQNPKSSAEIWGTFGSLDPSFEDRQAFFLPKFTELLPHRSLDYPCTPRTRFQTWTRIGNGGLPPIFCVPIFWFFEGVPQALHASACLKLWFWILMFVPEGLALKLEKVLIHAIRRPSNCQ